MWGGCVGRVGGVRGAGGQCCGVGDVGGQCGSYGWRGRGMQCSSQMDASYLRHSYDDQSRTMDFSISASCGVGSGALDSNQLHHLGRRGSEGGTKGWTKRVIESEMEGRGAQAI